LAHEPSAPREKVKIDMDAPLPKRPAAADDDGAPDGLFGVMYSELHRMARRELNRKGPFVGLGVTTLLHEAYLKMSGSEGRVFVDRARFMAYAARVMRGLIIDDLRRRRSQKRGGLFHLTSLGTNHADGVADPRTLLKIGDVLDELAEVEPELAEIIELKFFCGFSFAEIAAMRSVSERTIQRNWEKGRLYLHHAIANEPPATRLRAVPQP
jgi:RNA polymerase sigma factor (TIGR02999 family)